MHNEKVNKCSLAIAGMVIVLLITTYTSGSIMSASASAKHSGDVSQAASVRNSCLNPVSNSNTIDNMISNGNCGGTVSQQGRSGQASTPTTVQNANPTIEVQRATTTAQPPLTTTGGNCTACFDPLNATQKSELLIALSDNNLIPLTTTTIAQLCEFLGGLSFRNLSNAVLVIQGELVSLPHPVNTATSLSIEECLIRAFP